MKLFSCLLTAIACTTFCLAQQDPSAERLAGHRQALAKEQAELAALRAEIGSRRQALQQERQALAEQVVALRLRQLQVASQREDVEAELVAVRTGRKADQQRAQMVADALKSLRAQLKVVLSEVPGQQALQERLTEDDAAAPLAVAAELYRQAVGNRLDQAAIHRPSGEPATVELLSVSFARFAYRTPAGELALALASPSDASGYRWQEELPRETRTAIDQAFRDLAAGRQAMLPHDPTGNLREIVEPETATWRDTMRDGGLLMAPLIAVAVMALLLILERLIVYLREHEQGGLLRSVHTACQERDYTEAEAQLAENGRGFAARLLLGALQRRQQGQQAVEDAIEIQLLQESPRLRKHLGGIAVLGSVAPLLGLLGTVTGIIQTFAVIEHAGQADPSQMAGGISQALVTTAAGLIIAIPILLAHRLVAGGMERLISNAEGHAATLLNHLADKETPDA